MPQADLNSLVVSVPVVAAGSFSAAGRRFGMPALAVSRRVAGLEASRGTRLLRRSPRKPKPTEVSKEIPAHAEARESIGRNVASIGADLVFWTGIPRERPPGASHLGHFRNRPVASPGCLARRGEAGR